MTGKIFLTLAAVTLWAGVSDAQRITDRLDRGLVAMKTEAGVFCSWRINADEWHNTLYNIYRGDRKLNDTPLEVSNFMDTSGSAGDSYSVRAVVDGKETDISSPVKVWEKNYTIIKPQHAPEITAALIPNDATAADVDGDGQLEIIINYDNTAEDFHNGDNGIFTVIECLRMDGSLLWWINCGPNMGDFQNNEINIAAYDWDCDGRAEMVYRAADGTVIHMADGSTYTVGDGSINYRGNNWPGGQWFMRWGKEYLVYADGLTGKPYQVIEYPLKRVEDKNNPKGILEGGEYDGLINNEWGDGYGHRFSKYFFAAPYLDGHKPSIFLARGIYTKHKMIAYDVDPATHTLTERWRWNDIGPEWHGQGYHNMGIADVDWDGRDEIVFGSMVIDDNGHGLSTTGLGHGDSQHCGDFDPYTHGQEIFACNEDRPNNNFRNATTSKIYYRSTGSMDDGRANCGNFIDEHPGSEGISTRDGNLICGASHKALVGDDKSTVMITQNFRVFWDGDLCDESFDYSSGKNTQGAIFKARIGKIAVLEGSKTNNDTKGTPCLQGDILGDWREEYIMRDADNNIRIYTTDIPTPHRIYSLWHDHQYRNAMVWQMCGYNQTPHVSFALSEFEDITVPPAPLSLLGQKEVADMGVIDNSLDGKNVIVYGNSDITVNAVENASPAILTVNTPSWVQGHDDNDNITSEYYIHTIASGSFAGDMKLVKQGDGKLAMPAGRHTYSGPTEVWGGTLAIDGELQRSHLWLNRFSVLETSRLDLPMGLDMNYASELRIGSRKEAGTLNTGTLDFGFGAVIAIDVFADMSADNINAAKLRIETKDWINGPEYLQPVIRLTAHSADDGTTLQTGRYLIGEIGCLEGELSDIILLGIDFLKKKLLLEDGKLYLELTAYESGDKIWMGGDASEWNLDDSAAFRNVATGEESVFVPGDNVTFDDSASSTEVKISGMLKPASITFCNETKDYVLTGDGRIIGDASLVKKGEGTLTIKNLNSYTGGTYINGGRLEVDVLSNEVGTDYGALSSADTRIYISNNATLAVNANATLGQKLSIANGNATIDVPDGIKLTISKGISAGGIGQKLYKRGTGTMHIAGGNMMSRLVIEEGTVYDSEVDGLISLPGTVEFVNGSLYDADNSYTYTSNPANFVVAKGNNGALYMDARCAYTGKLTGEGKFTVHANWIRHELNGDWSGFEGELTAAYYMDGGDFKWNNDYGMPKATLNISKDVTFNAQGRKMSLANLKGTGNYHGTGTLTVGNDITAIIYNGSFSGNPKIVKTGKCDLYINRMMSGISDLTALDGTVSLSASKAPYDTKYFSSPLSIEGNAKLRGRGTVADITVSGNGTLEPGVYSDSNPHHYGTIFSTGNVTINPGATLSLYLRAAGKGNPCSSIKVVGTLKIDGNVVVEMNKDYIPSENDEFQLWTAGKLSGNPDISLPELPEGLEWDASGLHDTTGILRVVKANSISTIEDCDQVTCRVFDSLGIYLGMVETTKAEAAACAKESLQLSKGLYVLKLTSQHKIQTIKIRI